MAQEDRFELVDGRIVRMMTGAKQSHNVAATNIAAALLPQARRSGRRTTAGDTAVRTGLGRIRCLDVVVDGGPRNPDALEAARPVLVVEVASPRTSTMDATDKLDEYRAQGDIRLILLVDPDVVSVKLYRHDDDDGDWQIEKYDVLDEIIPLPEIPPRLLWPTSMRRSIPWCGQRFGWCRGEPKTPPARIHGDSRRRLVELRL